MTTEHEQFKNECEQNAKSMAKDPNLAKTTKEWINQANAFKYSYNFEWCDRPIIQYPQDILALQELVWRVKPDLIVETGVAHGGSVVLNSSLLALLDLAEKIPRNDSKRKVIAIDIDIRTHNKTALDAHPFNDYFELIESSSTDTSVVEYVTSEAKNHDRVLVILDSNHTHEHVLQELNAYAGLVTKESYCIVFDTIIEDLPDNSFPDRPWDKGDNPKTATLEFLQTHPEFEIDEAVEDKLMISVAPSGYLKRVG